MRCFFAIPVHGAAQQRLATALAGWRQQYPAVRWEVAPALHITLQFVGDWPTERTPQLAAAASFPWAPFTVDVSGVGAFPDRRHPRLLWAGVEHSQPLLELVTALAARLGPLGVERESRPFRPHISLGRVAAGASPGSWAAGPSFSWGRIEVREFCLYETVAGQPPAERYQVRARFPATSPSHAR